jgi:epoxyqueuosine reductase
VAAARTLPDVDDLCAIGRAAGLDAVGVCTAAPFVEARRAIEHRKATGLSAGMQFTFRDPERSTEPTRALRRAAALVVGAYAYRRAEPPRGQGQDPAARVAAYAWADHYGALRHSLGAVAQHVRGHGWRARVVVDDNALVDRAAAVRAGIGWAGKSTNVLLPGHGSWYVLGAVVTDAPLVTEDPVAVADGCGSCRRCLDGCPTGAIVAPGVVDARRCLSWLLQAPGMFPAEHRVALGDRLYGCDDCQEVCPPNRREDRAGRPPAEPGASAWVEVLEVLAATDDEILERHGRWYIWQREPRWVRRNALVVLGNRGRGDDPAVERALAAALVDPDPILRAHAVWAAARLGRHDLVATVAGDPAPEVQAELRASGATAGSSPAAGGRRA